MQEFIYKFKFVILTVILLVVGIFIYLKRDRIVIIDGVNGVFTYNGKWKYNRNFKKYDSKKYYIYSEGEYIGNYKMKYGSGWFVYSPDDIISYDYDLFASNKDSIKSVSYTESSDGYANTVEQFLRSKNINSSNYYYTVYDYDFDGDSLDEQLVFLSNFSMNNNEAKMYSFVFINNDEKFYSIKQSITNDLSKIELYSFSSMFDNSGQIQFIINTSYFSQPDKMCQELFGYDKGVKKLYMCK